LDNVGPHTKTHADRTLYTHSIPFKTIFLLFCPIQTAFVHGNIALQKWLKERARRCFTPTITTGAHAVRRYTVDKNGQIIHRSGRDFFFNKSQPEGCTTSSRGRVNVCK
jgi:hypothetical protein